MLLLVSSGRPLSFILYGQKFSLSDIRRISRQLVVSLSLCLRKTEIFTRREKKRLSENTVAVVLGLNCFHESSLFLSVRRLLSFFFF